MSAAVATSPPSPAPDGVHGPVTMHLPYSTYQTLRFGASKTSVVDPEVLVALQERAKAVSYVVIRGLLLFNAVLRSILTSCGGDLPLDCAPDLAPLARACIAAANPYSTGSRTALSEVSLRALTSCLSVFDADFPVTAARQALLTTHLRRAGGVLGSAADSVVNVQLAVLTGEPLRSAVRRALVDHCQVSTDEVDGLLDAVSPLSTPDRRRLSQGQHLNSGSGLSAASLLDQYFLARDPKALAKRRGASAIDASDDSDEGWDTSPDACVRICRSLSLKWLLLRPQVLAGQAHRRLPALVPVPACLQRALFVTPDCVPAVLSVAAQSLWDRAHALGSTPSSGRTPAASGPPPPPPTPPPPCPTDAAQGHQAAPAPGSPGPDPGPDPGPRQAPGSGPVPSGPADALRQRSHMLQSLVSHPNLPVEGLLNPVDGVVGPLLVRRGHLGVATLAFLGATFHITVPRVVMYTVNKPRVGVHGREVNFGIRGHVLRPVPGSLTWGSGRSRSTTDFLTHRSGEFDITAVPQHWDAAAEGATWLAADPGTRGLVPGLPQIRLDAPCCMRRTGWWWWWWRWRVTPPPRGPLAAAGPRLPPPPPHTHPGKYAAL